MAPTTETVECGRDGCTETFERPVGTRGRPRLYCSADCRRGAHIDRKPQTQATHDLIAAWQDV